MVTAASRRGAAGKAEEARLMTTQEATAADRQLQVSPAPGELETVRAFVNTLDIEEATDALTTPGGLSRWLAERGLAAPARVSGADLAQAVALREALRGVLRQHAGHPGEPGPPGGTGKRPEAERTAESPAAAIAGIAAALPVRLAVDDEGVIAAVAAAAGVQGALARLLLIAAAAAGDGTWSRLKVCSADDCQWAFYDRSPARNGRWCSMSICGSRAKSRAYRRRVQAS
jgi:predicted RNA-binding Zn ribbon-like protein